MQRTNLRALKITLVEIAAAAAISALLAGCAGVAPALKKTTAGVKSQVLVTLTSAKGKLKKKCSLAWSEPFFRMEVRGFLNEPVAGLSADSGRLRIYLYQSNLFYDEEVKNAGPKLCRLFSGNAKNPFEMNLNKTVLRFTLSYEEANDGSELPAAVKLSGNNSSALISFIKPDISYIPATDDFNLKIPANAVRISEDAVVRSLETWIN